LEFERSGFRFLGMVSHAAHINGFTADGRIWCGRRAQSKATDPGLWDNIAAGGVAAGESVLSCAVRELMEEAGLEVANPQALHDAGRVRITESIAQTGGADWHDEVLHAFNLYLQPGQVPVNHDGEVEQFQCFTAPQWMDAVRAGQCTTDSVLSLLQARYAQGRIGVS
jgi:8-oxo-dGTP pyrophosphatase MutT (NUDIX family)